jgi:CheY-like chemotaxis protein
MAIDLLEGERCSGLNPLSSSSGIDGAIREGVAESPSDSVPAGETTIGEVTIGIACPETIVWGGPETILLVEDESFVRKVTAEILESAGYRLMITKSAPEAFEACGRSSHPVDLLLADVVMPGMSGFELAAQFESSYPRTRVLLMSGYAEQLALCELSPCGKAYLAKPFSSRMLLSRVRQALGRDPCGWKAPH